MPERGKTAPALELGLDCLQPSHRIDDFAFELSALGLAELQRRKQGRAAEGQEATKMLAGLPTPHFSHPYRRHEQDHHDLHVPQHGRAHRAEPADGLKDDDVVDHGQHAAAEDDGQRGARVREAVLHEPRALQRQHQLRHGQQGEPACVERDLHRVQLHSQPARKGHLQCHHGNAGEHQQRALQVVAEAAARSVDRHHHAQRDQRQSRELLARRRLPLDDDAQQRHEDGHRRPHHLVQGKLHEDQGAVVQGDLDAVEKPDDQDALPLLLRDPAMLAPADPPPHHHGQQQERVEEHVGRREGQGEGEAVNSQRPAIQEVQCRVQGDVQGAKPNVAGNHPSHAADARGADEPRKAHAVPAPFLN
eukprot:CAMPEP_0204534920 /NCGR_PEP_ID=MMETSP0661-20131031/13314_1 /ASSEMBLY_ACC=CAM_ASM_000606 /TAXON_ID=109239 /ORGANISM="Alexandrium margalefi, Strain AMGDE01CS-322" /LENGTH=361 /DNA_ID=CAMNT_0051541391 /DNA_START=39 /DNA_END=1121 /DNA_ORIENTATION=-